MADDHHRFHARVFLQNFAEVSQTGFRTQSRIGLQLAFVAKFVAHQRRRLGGALQRTGDDYIDLHIQSRQSSADVSALLDAFLIEGALLIFLRIDEVYASAGVA